MPTETTAAARATPPGKLILVRHGQSIWNVENLFTGWTDVDLSEHGRAEAAQAGRELLQEKLAVDGPWQAIARTGLRDGALRVHRRLAERVLSRRVRGDAGVRVDAWVAAAGKELGYWQRTLNDMRAAGASDFATLSVGLEAVKKLAH